MSEPRRSLVRKAGVVLLFLWALLFVGGAVGELFEVEFLRDATDLKGIFLR